MKCAICENEANNTKFVLKEMMFGFRDEFEYFQCSACFCLQIKNIPGNLNKYYPANYYSYSSSTILKKVNTFKRLQFNQITGFDKSILGALACIKYKSKLYEWCKYLDLRDEETEILDIGSGSGELLKKMFNLNFKNLTGTDPFVERDIIYNENLRIYRKTIFELEGKFDLIMMHHALEHMPDQKKVLHRVHQLLSETGKVLIRIPVISKPLMEKYGVNVVSLDPPRHLFVHSVKSITKLVSDAGFKVTKMIFDTEYPDIIASEQYQQGISMLNDNRSYFVNKKASIFTKTQIKKFKKYVEELNKTSTSSSIAIYLEKNTTSL